MSLRKITEAELQGKGNLGKADTPGVSTAEMQRILDELPREVIIPAFNELSEQLGEETAAASLGAMAPGTDELPTDTPHTVQGVMAALLEYVKAHLLRSDNPHGVTAAQAGAYSKAETNAVINQKVVDLEALPAGGTTGQALVKASERDGDAVWVKMDELPPGGTPGQALLKTSDQDGAAAWADIDALPKGGATGNVLTKRSNADGDAAWLPADPGGGAAITNYDQIYPVGCYIYSSDTGFDPNAAYGGTWSLVAEGVTLRQAGAEHAVGTQYGEATHTLTAEEMPSHTHDLEPYHTFDGSATNQFISTASGGMGLKYLNTPKTKAAGDGQPHNNIGPSLAVNIWHKTASGGNAITGMTGDQLRDYIGIRKYTAVLPTAGWTQEADGSYTQTVACTGMTAAVVVWDWRGEPGATVADDDAIAEALGCITRVESLAGQVKVTCKHSRPAVDFTAVFKEE